MFSNKASRLKAVEVEGCCFWWDGNSRIPNKLPTTNTILAFQTNYQAVKQEQQTNNWKMATNNDFIFVEDPTLPQGWTKKVCSRSV